MLLTTIIYLLIPTTGVTITEINMHVAKSTDHLISVSSSPWALLLKLLAHSFPAKRDRHNQPGKVV